MGWREQCKEKLTQDDRGDLPAVQALAAVEQRRLDGVRDKARIDDMGWREQCKEKLTQDEHVIVYDSVC